MLLLPALMLIISGQNEFVSSHPVTPDRVVKHLSYSCRNHQVAVELNQSTTSPDVSFDIKLDGVSLPSATMNLIKKSFKRRSIEDVYVRSCGVEDDFNPIVMIQYGRSSAKRSNLSRFTELHFSGGTLARAVES